MGNTNGMRVDAGALIRSGAQRAEKTVPICLRLDLVAEWDDLERQRRDAVREAAGSLAGGRAVEIAGRMESLRAEMVGATINVRLRAMPRPKFQTLKRAHPPRSDEERDRMLGVNEETFFEPLLRISIVDPVLDEELFRTLVDERLSDAQYEELTTACWFLNTRTVNVPFLRAASETNRNSSDE